MAHRIIIAYLGAVGLPLLLLPVAMVNTMGGHSLMFISICSSPIGLIAALSYSDVKRHIKILAIVVRSTACLIVYILIFALVAYVSKISTSPFLKNQGWILIVLATPLIAAFISEQVMTNSQT